MSVPGFLTKTYEIFNSSEYNDCCGWGPNGDSIVIKKIDMFSKLVLPKFFKHGNYQSFVRQLNMYDFRKTMQDPTNGEFHHQYFIRNRPDLLIHIKRKAHGRAADATTQPLLPQPMPMLAAPMSSKKGTSRSDTTSTGKSKVYIPPEVVENETEMVLAELEQQTAMRNVIDRRLSALEKQHGQILSENMFLRNMVVESANKQALMQERMEKIFRVLYVYINGNGGGNGEVPKLVGRAKQLLLTDLTTAANSPGIRYIESGDMPRDGDRFNDQPLTVDTDDFELGLDLRHQSSFDSAAASVTAPSSHGSTINSNGLGGSFLERQPSIDYFYTPSADYTPSTDYSASNSSASSSSASSSSSSSSSSSNIQEPNNSNSGAGIRRMNSYTDQYRPSSRKRDASISFEYTSDRVTELPSVDSNSQMKRIRTNSASALPIPMPVSNDGNGDYVQPQLDYLQLLHRNQETTMARMDSLEMTIQSLLSSVDFDDEDNDDSNWMAMNGVDGTSAKS